MTNINDPDVQAELKARAAAGERGARILLQALADPNTVYLTDDDFVSSLNSEGDHCVKHCADDCDGGTVTDDGGYFLHAHEGEHGETRWEGKCPFCVGAAAEREQIADGLRQQARFSIGNIEVYAALMQAAANLDR